MGNSIWVENDESYWGRAEDMVDFINEELSKNCNGYENELKECLEKLENIHCDSMVQLYVNVMGNIALDEYVPR